MEASMDRSVRSLTDPITAPALGFAGKERRRTLRQKPYTPVYASFNGPQSEMVVDLSELLDLNEDGFAVQTSQRLEVNRAVTVCLDLPETKSYLHCTGRVVWSDATGRGGVRFSTLSEKSLQILKEWLFANLMIGCSNHSARTEQSARIGLATQPEPAVGSDGEPSTEAAPAIPRPRIVPPEGTAMLAAVEAVRLVIRDLGDDFDAILQLITERALSFTGASGAALALLTGDKMICRARAGEPAPPLGAPLDVKQGLSGECVRSGLLVSCEDAEDDARVDPDVCRALGIASLMAAPIVSDLRVVGLLEVFSPYRRRFIKVHGTVLGQLIDLIPKSHGQDREKQDREKEEREKKEEGEPEATTVEALAGSRSVAEVPASPIREESRPLDFASIHAAGETSPEAQVEVNEPAARNIPAENVSAEAPLDHLAEEAAPRHSPRLLYRVLLGLAIVAVFVVAGYLMAPLIDKRWAFSPQAAPRSSMQGSSTQGSSTRGLSTQPTSIMSNPPADSSTASGSASSGQSANDSNRAGSYLTDLRQLAEQGNPEAQWQLGARYHNGEGVPKDDVQAMLWFQRAADQGNVMAQATLGAYYWAGRGVPQDLTKAYFWSAVAFAQGDENSRGRLEGLTSQMTREQVFAARQQAEAWLRSHIDKSKAVAN